MFYDLNIAWSPSTSPDQLLQTLSVASSLGYGTVALNHTLNLPLPSNPISPFPPVPSSSSTSKLPHVLHRATVPLSDLSINHRLPSVIGVYDIVAIRPTTNQTFQNACLTLDVPLISLDFTEKFDFYFRPKPCMAAVSRGVRFEICYAQALAADPHGRARFISNVTGLIRATRGRGIILSSEAKSALGLRAPADVVNLFTVWGLGNEKGMEGLGSVPRGVVVNEGIKRSGFRGVIDIVQVAEKVDKQDGKGGARNSAPEKDKNQKRKPGEDGPAVGKRQAKKLKLAERAADSGK